MLKTKRAYDKVEDSDGKRILVDGLWPRGISKAEASINEWFKELAPSSELRKWFSHDPEKWKEFKARYRKELSSSEKAGLLESIAREASRTNITLIYSARDVEHSNLKVLEETIQDIMKRDHIPR